MEYHTHRAHALCYVMPPFQGLAALVSQGADFNVSYGLRVTLAITTTRRNKPYPLPEYKEEEALVAEK